MPLFAIRRRLTAENIAISRSRWRVSKTYIIPDAMIVLTGCISTIYIRYLSAIIPLTNYVTVYVCKTEREMAEFHASVS